MPQTLESFAARVHDILQADNSPAGRQKVAGVLSEALKDRSFVEAQFDDSTPERQLIYQDPQLGFCIVAHSYHRPKDSAPHDHGHSWAIYGQADGETAMSDWSIVEPASEDRPGKVRKLREYKLTPGVAHVYNEGDLHSPSRSGPTRLIRIEGTNMEQVQRLQYEPLAA